MPKERSNAADVSFLYGFDPQLTIVGFQEVEIFLGFCHNRILFLCICAQIKQIGELKFFTGPFTISSVPLHSRSNGVLYLVSIYKYISCGTITKHALTNNQHRFSLQNWFSILILYKLGKMEQKMTKWRCWRTLARGFGQQAPAPVPHLPIPYTENPLA